MVTFVALNNSIADERMKKLNQLFDDLKTQNYSAAYKVEQEIFQLQGGPKVLRQQFWPTFDSYTFFGY